MKKGDVGGYDKIMALVYYEYESGHSDENQDKRHNDTAGDLITKKLRGNKLDNDPVYDNDGFIEEEEGKQENEGSDKNIEKKSEDEKEGGSEDEKDEQIGEKKENKTTNEVDLKGKAWPAHYKKALLI